MSVTGRIMSWDWKTVTIPIWMTVDDFSRVIHELDCNQPFTNDSKVQLLWQIDHVTSILKVFKGPEKKMGIISEENCKLATQCMSPSA